MGNAGDNTKRYAHMSAPDCENCGTDLHVGRKEGRRSGWVCWACGYRTTNA